MANSDNLFFDAWKHYADEWQSVQNDWFKPIQDYWPTGSAKSYFDSMSGPDWVDQARFSWEQCQDQYGDWLKAIQEWFPESSPFDVENFDFANADMDAKMGFYYDSLKKMLDPSVFMQSGANELNQVFHRLVNIPEFADVGAHERRFMALTDDWMKLRKAGAAYQSILAGAWSEAFEGYTDEFSEFIDKNMAPSGSDSEPSQSDQYQSLRSSIDSWLKIANKQLLSTQRSPEFLDAQKELVNAATNFKLKTRQLVEDWCESFDIPTRSEVDDLHKAVHSLKKELRAVKNELMQIKVGASNAKEGSEPKAKPNRSQSQFKVRKRCQKRPLRKPASGQRLQSNGLLR